MTTESQEILASVVICTFNRASLVGDCVDSLLEQQASFRFEIIVVDDGSTDATKKVVTSKRGHDTIDLVYRSFPNGGVNTSRNRGLELSRGSVIIYIDDDELAPPNHVESITKKLLSEPQLDGVGGPCRECEDKGGPRTCKSCSLADADVGGEGVRLTKRLLGGNMAIRKSAFERVGPFDSVLSGRGDDDEWFYRARQAGMKFMQDADLWVWHRKDHLTLVGLFRHGFRQGLSVPIAQTLKGTVFKPRPKRILRALAHAVRRGCAKGIWDLSREMGATVGFFKMRYKKRFS